MRIPREELGRLIRSEGKVKSRRKTKIKEILLVNSK